MVTSKEILFYPAVSKEDFNALMLRVGWYLFPYKNSIREIGFLSNETLSLAELEPHPDIDPQAISNAIAFERELAVHREIPRAKLASKLQSFVFAWRMLTKTETKELAEQGWETVVNVDSVRSRNEGSHYLGISLRGFGDPEQNIAHSQAVLRRMGAAATGERVFIFGTGPSLSTIQDYDFRQGKAIAINSMVRNLDLLDRLDLLAITAADPIFHAGCSIYAAEFRRHLISALDRYQCFMIVPLRDFNVYDSFLPDRHRGNLIGIPFDAKKEYNIDLRNDYYVNPKPNVLTLFLFPLAATFFSKIAVAGCDGRPLSESQYFWSHDPKSQFNEAMEAIQRVHPGFFAIDYNDYYEEHVNTVAMAVDRIEASGRTVESLTPSFIPALGDRYHGFERPKVISINPDAVSRFGHYANYERHLRSEVERRGLSYGIIGPREADAEISSEFPSLKPLFSGRSWHLRCTPEPPSRQRVRSFIQEMRRAIALLRAEWSGPIVLFMYCGSFEAALAIESVLENEDDVVACVDLFYLSRIDFTESSYRERWQESVDRLSRSAKVRLFAPTQELSDEFEQAYAIRLPILAHPSTSYGDDSAFGQAARPEQAIRTVLFPSNNSEGKGAALFTATIEQLCADAAQMYRVRVRFARPESSKPEERAFFERIEGRAEILQGELSAQEFQDMMADADVVVLPYEPSEFRNRTSGLLVDALYNGTPVVVLNGTWLANVVDTYGFGVAVDADPDSLVDGVEAILRDLPRFAERAAMARHHFRELNSWKRLLDGLLQQSDLAILDGRRASGGTRQGVRAARSTNARAIVLGNGPSVQEHDYLQLLELPAVGMNAAYRYWDEIGRYPSHYACLDLVVGKSHAKEIARLIRNRQEYQIERFLLRRDLIEQLGEIAEDGIVVDFDALRSRDRVFAREPITTGSHVSIWMASLGFKELFLVGIDGYRQEIVPGARRAGGTILEIVSDQANGNYFFSGYQQVGDRYNIPNVEPDAHKRAWCAAAISLAELGAIAYNCNLQSKVDAFAYCAIEEAFDEERLLPPAAGVLPRRIAPLSRTVDLSRSRA